MPLFRPDEHNFAEAMARMLYCNPFTDERPDLERQALGEDFEPRGTYWSHLPENAGQNPNVVRLGQRVARVVERARTRLDKGFGGGDQELHLYAEFVLYHLFDRYENRLYHVLSGDRPIDLRKLFAEFGRDVHRLLSNTPGEEWFGVTATAHLFAAFFQVRRAFHFIFRYIAGHSAPAAHLRATAWQSIFSHDMHRYRRCLYKRMRDFPALIVGASGTGKELVARAIGNSQYLPFDPVKNRFQMFPDPCFFPVNLSALSPALIESELFGHRKGAFTGALDDHPGWLENCGAVGSVFLDEIGEITPAIQVKLLRVLETRHFSRLGETTTRRFDGKIIAATNRDLPYEMQQGTFRKDLYYRLCSDVIRTPTLREQIRESDDALPILVSFLARRIVGEQEAEALAEEVGAWIDAHLPADYDWPGNVRELEQCVRNVLIRGSYTPARPTAAAPDADPETTRVLSGDCEADEVLTWYCRRVYREAGNLSEAARRLGLDRRTVKARLQQPEESN